MIPGSVDYRIRFGAQVRPPKRRREVVRFCRPFISRNYGKQDKDHRDAREWVQVLTLVPVRIDALLFPAARADLCGWLMQTKSHHLCATRLPSDFLDAVDKKKKSQRYVLKGLLNPVDNEYLYI